MLRSELPSFLNDRVKFGGFRLLRRFPLPDSLFSHPPLLHASFLPPKDVPLLMDRDEGIG